MEKPYKELLDRDFHDEHIEEHYSEVFDVLRQVVNYGTNLIVRCFSTSDQQLKDVIVIMALLRQAVSMLDAIEILVSRASTYPAYLQLRAIFECSLYIEWILEGDSKLKADHYYISNKRKVRKWLLRSIKGTDEHTNFDKILKPLGGVSKEIYDLESEVKKDLENLDKYLNESDLASVNQTIERFKKKSGKPYDPSWYQSLGVRSVRQLAIKLDRLSEYEIFYAISSEVMHSSKQDEHLNIGDGIIHFMPIRSLKDIFIILTYTISITIRLYETILSHYRPGEIESFWKKYREEWRLPFIKMKDTRYTYDKPKKIF